MAENLAENYDLETVLADGDKGVEEKLHAETEIQISTEILIMLFLLMISTTLGHFLKRSGHRYLQEAGLTVIIGMICGLLLKLFGLPIYLKEISTHFETLFLILLLPPIIFESGYNMEKRVFFRNIGTVIAYSFVGTFVAIFSTSLILYIFQNPAFTLKESFAFGSLISATDPVSVLAIFKELDADPNLYSVVFGESIFNDAIGIVMYETVRKLGKEAGKPFQQELGGAIGAFSVIFVGSLLIGALSALFVAFVQKRQAIYMRYDEYAETKEQEMQERNPNPIDAGAEKAQAAPHLSLRQKHYVDQQNFNSELSMMIMCPWVSYLVADGLGLSGIVAILTNGVFLNMYAAPNVSRASRKVLMIAYETIAYSAETLVFLFLGIGVFAFDHPLEEIGAGAIILAILNFNIARGLNVLVVSFLVNRTRSEATRITRKAQFVMWVAGLRGAMAYALAMQSIQDYGKAGRVMLSITLIYALLTILGVGSLLNPLLRKCGVTRQPDDGKAEAQAVPSDGRKRCCQDCKAVLVNFNARYFGPLFIKDDLKNQKDVARLDGDAAEDKTKVVVNQTLEEIRDDNDWNEPDSPTAARSSSASNARLQDARQKVGQEDRAPGDFDQL